MNLCSGDGKPYAYVARRFYSNIHAIETENMRFRTYAFGRSFSVTPALLREILEIPRLDNPTVFPLNAYEKLTEEQMKIKVCLRDADQALRYKLERKLCEKPTDGLWSNLDVNSLKPKYKVLYQIVKANIIPSVGNKSIMKQIVAEMLYCIGTGLQIDICQLLVAKMITAYNDRETSTYLPYPRLISRIIEYKDISIPTSEYVEMSMGIIDKQYLKKSEAASRKIVPPAPTVEVPPSEPKPSAPPATEQVPADTQDQIPEYMRIFINKYEQDQKDQEIFRDNVQIALSSMCHAMNQMVDFMKTQYGFRLEEDLPAFSQRYFSKIQSSHAGDAVNEEGIKVDAAVGEEADVGIEIPNQSCSGRI